MRYFLLLSLVLAAFAAPQDEVPAPAAAPAPEAAAPAPEAAAAAPAAAPAAAEAAAPEEATAVTEPPCRKCPDISVQHYVAKGCTPVTDEAVDPCCPAYYTCPSQELSETKCVYNGVTYELDQEVKVAGPCRIGCKCKKSITTNGPAEIVCGIVQCPEIFSPPKRNCRPTYSIDSCCAVGETCTSFVNVSEVAKPETAVVITRDCFYKGYEYFVGDKILFADEPCKYCTCTKEFSGPDGPGCTKVDCGMDYRDRKFLRDGCIPLYVYGQCCNTEWICPDYLSNYIVPVAENTITGNETATTHCRLGTVSAARGESLTTRACTLLCSCLAPPNFTCVAYPNCEMALKAQREKTAP